MAAAEDKNNDFYAVLGLEKECTSAELRHAYKKLALKWHPDRFSASGNPKYVDEAKKKFQAIQQAYSVLSDSNKRFLYDVGVYDCNDDEDNNGMGEFLNEMATMMSQTKSDGSGNETFEELQELFDELFQSDIDAFGSSSRSATPPTCSSSSSTSGNEAYAGSNKRNSTEMRPDHFEGFCMGLPGKHQAGDTDRRKNARKGRRPKHCRVYGWLHNNPEIGSEKMILLTEFTYDLDKRNIQTFKVESTVSNVVDTIRLDFASNHGSDTHTCIYRLRVHGHEPSPVPALEMQP